jgi:hypothetical protein
MLPVREIEFTGDGATKSGIWSTLAIGYTGAVIGRWSAKRDAAKAIEHGKSVESLRTLWIGSSGTSFTGKFPDKQSQPSMPSLTRSNNSY